jgi:hypothetical protein
MLPWCGGCHLSCLPCQVCAAISRPGLTSCHHHCHPQPLFMIPLRPGSEDACNDNARNSMPLTIVVRRHCCLTRTNRRVLPMLIMVAFVIAVDFIVNDIAFFILPMSMATTMVAATICLTHDPPAAATAVVVWASYLHH